MDFWTPITAIGTVAAAGIAAWAAWQAKDAATKITRIESERHQTELRPRLRISSAPLNPGSDTLRMRVALIGPPGLDRVDRLTVAIRNDHFLRGEGPYQERMGGPTREQIKAHVWGPMRFTPGTGTGESRADGTGRVTVYNGELPTGEELLFQLEPTNPPSWAPDGSYWKREVGTLVRLAFTAEHDEHGTWYLPCEIDMANLPATVIVPEFS
jgi:hypothetical protein